MSEFKSLSRREALERVLQGGALLALPILGFGCSKKELQCSDTTGLSPAEVDARNGLHYDDHAPDSSKTCDACQLYKPGGQDACGGCLVVKGPIHPKGTCTVWAKKVG